MCEPFHLLPLIDGERDINNGSRLALCTSLKRIIIVFIQTSRVENCGILNESFFTLFKSKPTGWVGPSELMQQNKNN
jgi:hypothetical protein